MKKLLVMLGIGLCLQQAHATNWVQVLERDDHTIYLDISDNIKTNRFANGNTYISIWAKKDYHQEQKIGSNKYSSAKMLQYLDCQDQKISIGPTILYNKQGKPIYQHDSKIPTHSSVNWDTIVPDTLPYVMCSVLKK